MNKYLKLIPSWKDVAHVLKEEVDFRDLLNKTIEPTLPSTLFLEPCELIFTRTNVDPLFPELKISEEVNPEYLPFNLSDFMSEITINKGIEVKQTLKPLQDQSTSTFDKKDLHDKGEEQLDTQGKIDVTALTC